MCLLGDLGPEGLPVAWGCQRHYGSRASEQMPSISGDSRDIVFLPHQSAACWLQLAQRALLGWADAIRLQDAGPIGPSPRVPPSPGWKLQESCCTSLPSSHPFI